VPWFIITEFNLQIIGFCACSLHVCLHASVLLHAFKQSRKVVAFESGVHVIFDMIGA
jgi:hypothetical protein